MTFLQTGTFLFYPQSRHLNQHPLPFLLSRHTISPLIVSLVMYHIPPLDVLSLLSPQPRRLIQHWLDYCLRFTRLSLFLSLWLHSSPVSATIILLFLVLSQTHSRYQHLFSFLLQLHCITIVSLLLLCTFILMILLSPQHPQLPLSSKRLFQFCLL